MKNDEETLKDLNIQISDAENRGDSQWLDTVIASKLAFQRADKKTVEDKVTFLEKVAPGGTRETQIVEPIELYGDRAIVQCIITVVKDEKKQSFHNLRMFVRQEGQWKLLGWANEPM